jgi:uncharacterized membrane protein
MPVDRNPDHWKLLFLYYNPDDLRLFVRKRTGLGHTVNCARPVVWAVGSLFAIIALALAIVSNRLPR